MSETITQTSPCRCGLRERPCLGLAHAGRARTIFRKRSANAPHQARKYSDLSAAAHTPEARPARPRSFPVLISSVQNASLMNQSTIAESARFLCDRPRDPATPRNRSAGQSAEESLLLTSIPAHGMGSSCTSATLNSRATYLRYNGSRKRHPDAHLRILILPMRRGGTLVEYTEPGFFHHCERGSVPLPRLTLSARRLGLHQGKQRLPWASSPRPPLRRLLLSEGGRFCVIALLELRRRTLKLS